jgi:hypothetical protein
MDCTVHHCGRRLLETSMCVLLCFVSYRPASWPAGVQWRPSVPYRSGYDDTVQTNSYSSLLLSFLSYILFWQIDRSCVPDSSHACVPALLVASERVTVLDRYRSGGPLPRPK